MSKLRMIDTKIWHDSWIRKLNALDRYLFIYLLSNDKCSYCGIYELPLSIMAFETGIDERDLEKSMLPRLEPKIFYHDNWVCITNFKKFHVSDGSENSQKGYNRALSQVPSHIIKIFEEKIKPLQAPPSTSGSFPSSFTLSFTSPSTSNDAIKSLKNNFDLFWNLYPKKVEKKKSKEKWDRLSLEDQNSILKDIPLRKSSKQWLAGYIPNPMTYLNGERWNDEMASSLPSKPMEHLKA